MKYYGIVPRIGLCKVIYQGKADDGFLKFEYTMDTIEPYLYYTIKYEYREKKGEQPGNIEKVIKGYY